MSAIDIHIGTQDPEDRDATLVCNLEGIPVGSMAAELADNRKCVPDVSSTHTGLTRMVWVRRTIEDLLAGRGYEIRDGASLGKGGSDQNRLFFKLHPRLDADSIPFKIGAHDLNETGIFGMASKMACPTFDLPAGSPLSGGSCPGATAGQSIVPLQIRLRAERDVFATVRIQETICQICYAEGGNYDSPHVQGGELLRYWWCRALLDEGGDAGYQEWVDTISRALEGESWFTERMIDPRTQQQVKPVRIHSAGDFYSPRYARAWIDVANRHPDISFWAPTRTWAAAGWIEHWRKLMPLAKHGNFMVRPSAYHTGDRAPDARNHPWPGDYPFSAAGTTAIYGFEDEGQGKDERYDWACRAYAVVDDAKDCRHAAAPDGADNGCRACWMRPELRVDYTAH